MSETSPQPAPPVAPTPPVAPVAPTPPVTPLDPTDVDWQGVSQKYLAVELISTILFGVIVCAVFTVVWLFGQQPWALWVLAAAAFITLVDLFFVPRRVRSIGYVLRPDDLVFRRGIMFQRIVAVPYGRMQLIDITRGPIARPLGLADLKFVTAAPSTAVAIPGLSEANAIALRDRLVELAESRRAGL